MGQVGGRWNYQLARQRHDRAFNGHQKGDERVTTRTQRPHIPINQGFEHGALLYKSKPGAAQSFREQALDASASPRSDGAQIGYFPAVAAARNARKPSASLP